MKKRILDVCCGSRMFWFDKKNPETVFMDIRDEEHTLCDGRKLEVHPDIVADFTNIPFEDESFRLVVFDPPHLTHHGEKGWMFKKYGKLPRDWESLLKKGFDECMRVLRPDGVLIFKWNETDVTANKILKVIETTPLFGHKSGKLSKTHWMCFIK